LSDGEFRKGGFLREIGGLFPNRFVDEVGELEVMRNLAGILERSTARAVIVDAIGRVVGHGDLIGFSRDELAERGEACGLSIDGINFRGIGELAGEDFGDGAISSLVEVSIKERSYFAAAVFMASR